MKTLKYIFALFILSTFMASCSKDDDSNEIAQNPVEGLQKVMDFSEVDHTIEIYSTKPNLEVGYNEISLRFSIKTVIPICPM